MRTERAWGRWGAAVLVAAVLAAACGGGGDDDPSAGAGATTSSTTAVTAAPGATDGSGQPVDGAGGSPAGPGAAGDGGGSGGEGGGAVTTVSSAPADAVIPVGSVGVGAVAPPLLRPGRGDRVVIEVRAQAGAAPAAATLDHVASVIGAAAGKPVSIDGVDALGGGGRAWTAQEIVATAAAAAQVESGRDQVVLRLLFLRGTYQGDDGILGVAVAGDVAAVFSDRVAAAAGILVSPAVVEDAVTMHEVGHLLGLVDLLLGTGRGDPAHPGHSRNQRSVMYWQVESGLITQLLDGGIPRDYDADDRAELAAIRAG
jgi:hypothetical protein